MHTLNEQIFDINLVKITDNKNIEQAKEELKQELLNKLNNDNILHFTIKDINGKSKINLRMLAITPKIKIKYVGINSKHNKCYISSKGSYVANVNGDYRILRQSPKYGYSGIEGEESFKIRKSRIEIVEEF